jgi:hypothetical protein
MPCAALVAQASLRDLDWFGAGLFLALAGALLLAYAALFLAPMAHSPARPRGASADLGLLRDEVFFRVQLFLGFPFLVGGFGLQVAGWHSARPGSAEFPVFAASGVVLLVVLLEIGAWATAHRLFRRRLREHFLLHPPDFETDTALAREVGSLVDTPSRAGETVQSYVERLRRALDLPAPPRRERSQKPSMAEADEELS